VKHINVLHHYLRGLVHAEEIAVEFIRGKENSADLFTKPLPRIAHESFLSELNIVSIA
jgi:hypothetical protein